MAVGYSILHLHKFTCTHGAPVSHMGFLTEHLEVLDIKHTSRLRHRGDAVFLTLHMACDEAALLCFMSSFYYSSDAHGEGQPTA